MSPVDINGSTRVYAVFGDPVTQVQTPRLINPIFAAAGCNLVAVPFHVTPSTLTATWAAFRQLSNIAGIGVTVPHKVAAAGLCDSLTDAARQVGAVNSIQRRADGSMHGALFDGIGFVQGLASNRSRLKGAEILLLGAGGAGRAIAHTLATETPASVMVMDRDAESVAFTVDLINEVSGGSIARKASPDAGQASVWINATPVGLKPGDEFPVDLGALTPDTLVADIASLSRETELLARARALGCVTSDGNDMLNAQISLIAGFAAGHQAGHPLA